jgi:transcriptional regulator with XRE-family HTH domain
VESDELLTALGRVVRARRVALGYSQESFAEALDVHRTYVGAIERGEQNVSLRNLARIARALDLSLTEMFEEIEAGGPRTAGANMPSRGRRRSRSA